jgi:hypothetical protein
MKINEITEEPVSGFKTKLQGLGSQLLNRVPGMKNRALNLAARADLGDTARNAYTEFVKWLGNNNKKINQATGNDLKLFFNYLKLTPIKLPPGPVDQKTINSAMMNAATQVKTKSSTATTTVPAAGRQKSKVSSKDIRSSDTYEKYKSKVRTLKSPTDRPLPNKFVQSVTQDIAKLAKGDKESGALAAERILKFARAGRDVRGLQQQWLNSAKAGERFLTQSVYRFASNLLSENNLTWKDLGLRVRLTESHNNKKFILILQL